MVRTKNGINQQQKTPDPPVIMNYVDTSSEEARVLYNFENFPPFLDEIPGNGFPAGNLDHTNLQGYGGPQLVELLQDENTTITDLDKKLSEHEEKKLSKADKELLKKLRREEKKNKRRLLKREQEEENKRSKQKKNNPKQEQQPIEPLDQELAELERQERELEEKHQQLGEKQRELEEEVRQAQALLQKDQEEKDRQAQLQRDQEEKERQAQLQRDQEEKERQAQLQREREEKERQEKEQQEEKERQEKERQEKEQQEKERQEKERQEEKERQAQLQREKEEAENNSKSIYFRKRQTPEEAANDPKFIYFNFPLDPQTQEQEIIEQEEIVDLRNLPLGQYNFEDTVNETACEDYDDNEIITGLTFYEHPQSTKESQPIRAEAIEQAEKDLKRNFMESFINNNLPKYRFEPLTVKRRKTNISPELKTVLNAQLRATCRFAATIEDFERNWNKYLNLMNLNLTTLCQYIMALDLDKLKSLMVQNKFDVFVMKKIISFIENEEQFKAVAFCNYLYVEKKLQKYQVYID